MANETARVWRVHRSDTAYPNIADVVKSLHIRRVTINVLKCELLKNFQKLILVINQLNAQILVL